MPGFKYKTENRRKLWGGQRGPSVMDAYNHKKAKCGKSIRASEQNTGGRGWIANRGRGGVAIPRNEPPLSALGQKGKRTTGYTRGVRGGQGRGGGLEGAGTPHLKKPRGKREGCLGGLGIQREVLGQGVRKEGIW